MVVASPARVTLNAPSVAVHVWVARSLFTTSTVSPTLTVIGSPKAKSAIVIVATGGPAGVAGPVVVGDVSVVLVGDVSVVVGDVAAVGALVSDDVESPQAAKTIMQTVATVSFRTGVPFCQVQSFCWCREHYAPDPSDGSRP